MTKPAAKRRIAAQPITNFATSVVDFILRSILTINILKLLVFYFTMVIVVSFLCSIQRPAPGYFSDKRNMLNQYFVKLGWAWTLAGICSLIAVTNFIENRGEYKNISSPLIRLLLMTLYWYACTHSFEWLDGASGTCEFSPDKHVTKRSCRREGFGWHGFDISGHCFLLLLSIIFINQESQVLEKVSRRLDSFEKDDKEEASFLYINCRLYLRLVTIFLVFLMTLWTIMMFFTAVYFHTVLQKFLGLLFASLGWVLMYKILQLGPQRS